MVRRLINGRQKVSKKNKTKAVETKRKNANNPAASEKKTANSGTSYFNTYDLITKI